MYRNYYHVGIAIGSDKGLVVPVLRNAERLSFSQIEMAIADFAKRARDPHGIVTSITHMGVGDYQHTVGRAGQAYPAKSPLI